MRRSQEIFVKRCTALAALAVLLAACNKSKPNESSLVQTAPVTRQDIVVQVEATGVIQPINTVQVRSKASGQIIRMPVEMGSHVKPGDLLVQVDPRQVQNVYDQSVAARAAAEANLTVTKTQLDRAQELAKEGVITAPELETATLNYANARSQLAAAKTMLENARIALEDATIRAPMAGTVIEKDVSVGQVIASATNTVGGGTLLMQMADLGQVMDSALVSESDIGHVKPGLAASVRVDAYPNRVFHGTVQKIAPQATVQQSVTMFPVLILLANEDGALMPGMNSDVTISVSSELNVLAVPNDAVRSPRDGAAVADALGVDADKVTKSIQQQFASQGGGAPGVQQVAEAGALARGGDAPRGGNGGAAGARSGDTAPRAISAGGASGGTPRPGGGGTPGAPGGFARGGRGGGRGGFGGGRGGSGGGSTQRVGLVFLADSGTFVPRLVTLGTGNYDVTQVLAGLKQGDQVALVTTAMLMQAQKERQQRIQQFRALPGMNNQQQQQRGSTSTRRPSGGGGR